MAEKPVFDPNCILGDGISELSRSKLVALAADLCVIAYKERGENGYRGGIRPDNISIGPDSSIAIGPAEKPNKDDCSKEELEYISPELFWSGKAGSRSDVYSIGLLLYTGITGGTLPFVKDGSDADCAEAFRKRMNGDKVKAPLSIGRKFKAIIEQAVEFDANARFENTLVLAEELKSLLTKPDTDSVSHAALEAFGKPESELSDVEKMMLGIITNAALRDDLADISLEEQAEIEAEESAEEDIEVEIEELPPEPDEPEDEESIEVEIEELPPEPDEPEAEESIEVEIEELPAEDNIEPEPEVVPLAAVPTVDEIVKDFKAEEAMKQEEQLKKESQLKHEAPVKKETPIEVPKFVNEAKAPAPAPVPTATPVPKKQNSKRSKSLITVLALCAVLVIASVIYNNISGKNSDGVNRKLPPITYVTPEPTQAAEPQPSEEPVETAAPVESEEPVKKESSYQIFVENISWDQAEQKCAELGGHLVAIGSEEEYNKVCELLNGTNAKYVWIGCYRSSAGVLTWTSGENIEYYNWAANEPSLRDAYDGTYEDYIMLARQPDGSWKYNDSRINPIADYSYFYSGRVAYICEITE